ncbi:MAG: hypothetical protein WCF67_15790 [Chitinophagaceae bacterium]
MTFNSAISDLKKILECSRLSLGNWPSPLEQRTAHRNFFIKRDDLSGYGRGGIKTRKLEAVFAYLIDKKITDAVLVVPNVSNLRSDIELFARDHAIRFHLILANDPFIAKEKRKLPDKTSNVFYTLAGTSKTMTSWKLIKKYAVLKLSGKKAAWFFPGMAHPAAVMGAAAGLLEMVKQYKDQNIDLPKHVFISGCTGTGAAGLLLASAILKQHKLADITIHTVKVFPLPLKLWIAFLLRWTKMKYRLQVNLSNVYVNIHTEQGPVNYGHASKELETVCTQVQNGFNIRIDPIYGARSWTAMNNFVKDSYKADGLVFWHCGFTPDWNMFK